MKKLIPLLLIFTMLASLAACSEDDSGKKKINVVISSTTEYTDGNALSVVYTYDKNNNCTQSTHTFNFGGYNMSTVYTHECDEYGRITVMSDGTSSTKNFYSIQGYLERAELYYDGEMEAEQFFLYDDNDLLIRLEMYVYDALNYYVEYSYDENGTLIKSVNYDALGAQTSYTLYEFSSDGLTRTDTSFTPEGELVYTQITHYKTIKIDLDCPRQS